MKVLQVLPSMESESGGPVRSTLANCQAVHTVDPNIESTLTTTGNDLDSSWRGSFEQRMPRGMDLKVFPAVGKGAFIFSLRLIKWLLEELPTYDLAVIRGVFTPVSVLAAWAARECKTPYIVVPHGTLSRYTFEYRRSLLKELHFYLFGRRMLSEAAGVRFTSESERREAPPWGGNTRTSVIPHPYEPVFNIHDSREENPRQILFLSRLHPKKGVEVLLEAASYIRSEIPGIQLVLAGSGPAKYEEKVRSYIRRLDLEEVVQMPGFVEGERKWSLLAGSAMFVLPSHQENFGIAVVEAMDAGIPVVISRGVDIWERVEDAAAGIVVRNRVAGLVADAIVRLLRDPKLRERMGNNGRQLVRRSFNPEVVGREVLALYRAAADD